MVLPRTTKFVLADYTVGVPTHANPAKEFPEKDFSYSLARMLKKNTGIEVVVVTYSRSADRFVTV